jgi:hypothetical protein
MFKKIDIKTTLISASIAAILFCIPAFIYIYKADYTKSWLLYFGSFLFFIVMWVHTMHDSKKRGENESTVALVFASHVTTIAGVILSTFFCFLILVALVPGYLDGGMADKILTGEPANIIKDKTNGLSFEVFIAATIINFSVGSFTGIILPFYSKRNQVRDSREPTPLHQRGTK